MKPPLLSISAHHSEPGDPILLEWIRHQIDVVLGMEPGPIVAVLGTIIVLIPLAIIVIFLVQRGGQGR